MGTTLAVHSSDTPAGSNLCTSSSTHRVERRLGSVAPFACRLAPMAHAPPEPLPAARVTFPSPICLQLSLKVYGAGCRNGWRGVSALASPLLRSNSSRFNRLGPPCVLCISSPYVFSSVTEPLRPLQQVGPRLACSALDLSLPHLQNLGPPPPAPPLVLVLTPRCISL